MSERKEVESEGNHVMSMLCTLRLVGYDLSRSTIAQAVKPIHSFRLDRPGEDLSDCFHFDVAEADAKNDLHDKIVEFLVRNQAALLELKSNPKINLRNLDIGLIVDEQQMSKSFDLNEDLITKFHELGLTASVAFYKAAPETAQPADEE
jgi:hypothetical protein